MPEARVTIRPRIDRLQPFNGALLLGMVALIIGLCIFLLTLPAKNPAPIPAGGQPALWFFGALFLLFLAAITALGARMALETQIWIAGHDYFECRSQILFLKWRKTYRASAWRIECQNHKGHISYTLSPVGARISGSILPFYSTPGVLNALNLGRQLANVTGWPLRLSGEMQRLELELAKELST